MPDEPRQSKYTNRWAHRTKLVFRVWPKCRETHLAIQAKTEIPVTGMYINDGGHMEVWHQIHGVKAYRFELQDEDLDVLASVAVAEAKMVGKMIVRTPGTLDARVKQECWLEVPVVAYPDRPPRTGKRGGGASDPTVPKPKNLFAETPEAAVAASGIPCGKIVLVENDDDLEEELMLREVIEHDALVVLCGCGTPGGGVSGARTRELMARAKYWVVPGRRPEAEGGALRGYQFCDRIVRWVRRVDPEHRAENNANRLEVMHAITRDRGQAARRTYFIETTVNRFAERVGMSRQRVMARFLDDGMLDAMVRSADRVKTVAMRDTPTLLNARVSEAVNTLEFYYRAKEALAASGAI